MQRFIPLFIVPLLFVIFQGCYLTKQGYHQIKLFGERQPFYDALRDPKVSMDAKRKILLVRQVKRFAISEIGLRPTGSYSHFIRIKTPYVAYNLSAAPKDKLTPIIWSFPIVGRVPYLGFFEKADAVKEEKRLIKRGLDTRLRGIPAYSTLGFFSDPLLSTMVKYPDPLIINTIIHEMTHETIFFKDNIKFNEGIATFVGGKGSIMFLERYYGKKSKWIRYVKDSHHDSILFSRFIKRFTKELTAYFSRPISRKTKIRGRERIYKKYQKYFQVTVLPKLKTGNYTYFPKIKLNNAYILAFRRYYLDISFFEKVYQRFDGNLKKTIVFLKKFENVRKNPQTVIEYWLQTHKHP